MQVKIYTTNTCPYCRMAKKYLDEKGVKYENFFVDQDDELAQKMIEESGQMGVPFTEVIKDDGTVIKVLGFDKDQLDQALQIT